MNGREVVFCKDCVHYAGVFEEVGCTGIPIVHYRCARKARFKTIYTTGTTYRTNLKYCTPNRRGHCRYYQAVGEVEQVDDITRCPLCGRAVRVVGGDSWDGPGGKTRYYEPATCPECGGA